MKVAPEAIGRRKFVNDIRSPNVADKHYSPANDRSEEIMRAFITLAMLTVTTLTVSAGPAMAQTISYGDLVDSWYHRYLGRRVDPIGRADHVRALRHGTPANVVEAAILSSPEYYLRNGNTPEGYVAALYRDVLGRRAGVTEFSAEVSNVITLGRNAVALQVMALRTPTVVVTSAPVVVSPPVVVNPVVVAPVYHPVPRYYGPGPGISIRFGIR